MVEALTIVLAIGVSRGWRSTLHGALLALALLILLIVLFGSTLATVVPLNFLRLIVGLGLLVFGLQWLRKAVERAAGRRPLRDEAATFDRLRGRLSSGAASERQLDTVAFAAAFKGVFLEGLEAAIIVVTLGVTAGQLPVSYASGGVAIVGITAAYLLVTLLIIRLLSHSAKGGANHSPVDGAPKSTF